MTSKQVEDLFEMLGMKEAIGSMRSQPPRVGNSTSGEVVSPRELAGERSSERTRIVNGVVDVVTKYLRQRYCGTPLAFSFRTHPPARRQ
jgi:hypothetical protein